MSNLILKVSTDKVNSVVDVDLGYTTEEWDELFDGEQDDIVNEKVWEVINTWIV